MTKCNACSGIGLVDDGNGRSVPCDACAPDLEYTPFIERLPELVRASEVAALRERVAELEAAIWKNCRDWDNAPDAAEWWAVDADGSAWFFVEKPRVQTEAWGGIAGIRFWRAGVRFWRAGYCPLSALGLDWRDTLTARPEAPAL